MSATPVAIIRERRNSKQEVTAVESNEEDWWVARAAAVRAFLTANPLHIGFAADGSVDTITSQLTRGDHFPEARRKCWKHLTVEMESLAGWDHDRAMPDRTFFKASVLSKMEEPPPLPPTPVPPSRSSKNGAVQEAFVDDGPQSPMPPTSPTAPAVHEGAASTPPPPVPALDMDFVADGHAPLSKSARSCAPEKLVSPALPMSARTPKKNDAKFADESAAEQALPAPTPLSPSNKAPEKPLSQMTMMERQEHWMMKKKAAVEAQRKEKEKENNNFSFKPDTGNSKRTYKTSENLRPTPPAPAVVEKAAVSESRGGSSKWGAVRAKVKGGEVAGKKKSKGAAKSKAAVADREKKSVPVKQTKLPTAMSLARAASNKSLASQGTAAGNADVGSAVADAQESAEEEEDKKEEEPEVSSPVPEAPPAEPFVAGQFWWKTEAGRGHHRVRDGSDFQMWSIYRKKDKSRDVKGVSILVGRMEEPPYEEKVIQMMWDTDEWTEEAAFNWWKENDYRYLARACADTGKLVVAVKPLVTPAVAAS